MKRVVKKGSRAQAAVEYVMLATLMAIIVLPSVYLFYSYIKQSSEQIDQRQLESTAADVVTKAAKIYYTGPGTRVVYETRIPSNVVDAGIRQDPVTKQYVLVFNVTSGGDKSKVTQVAYPSSVPLKGIEEAALAAPGVKKINLETFTNKSDSFVLVRSGEVCNNSTKYDFDNDGDSYRDMDDLEFVKACYCNCRLMPKSKPFGTWKTGWFDNDLTNLAFKNALCVEADYDANCVLDTDDWERYCTTTNECNRLFPPTITGECTSALCSKFALFLIEVTESDSTTPLGTLVSAPFVEARDGSYHLFSQQGTKGGGGLRWWMSDATGSSWQDMGQVSASINAYASAIVRENADEVLLVYSTTLNGRNAAAAPDYSVYFRKLTKLPGGWQMGPENVVAAGDNNNGYTYADLELDSNRVWVAYRHYDHSPQLYFAEVKYSSGFSETPTWEISAKESSSGPGQYQSDSEIFCRVGSDATGTDNAQYGKPTLARWTDSLSAPTFERIAIAFMCGLDSVIHFIYREDTDPLTSYGDDADPNEAFRPQTRINGCALTLPCPYVGAQALTDCCNSGTNLIIRAIPRWDAYKLFGSDDGYLHFMWSEPVRANMLHYYTLTPPTGAWPGSELWGWIRDVAYGPFGISPEGAQLLNSTVGVDKSGGPSNYKMIALWTRKDPATFWKESDVRINYRVNKFPYTSVWSGDSSSYWAPTQPPFSSPDYPLFDSVVLPPSLSARQVKTSPQYLRSDKLFVFTRNVTYSPPATVFKLLVSTI